MPQNVPAHQLQTANAVLAGIALIASLIGLVAGGPILWMMRAPGPGTGITLYQKNLLFANRAPLAVVEDILASDADVVMLQEVTEAHASTMARLREVYPVSVVCPFARVGGVAVLSRWPMAGGGTVCDPEARRGYVAMQVAGPGGPVWLVSVHLHWPWPYRQGAQVARMAEELAQLDGPVLMAGDFNMVPWTHALRQLAEATGTRPLGPLMQTLERPEFPFLRLRIDHVYVPTGWQGAVERRPRLGSDHFGFVARIDS